MKLLLILGRGKRWGIDLASFPAQFGMQTRGLAVSVCTLAFFRKKLQRSCFRIFVAAVAGYGLSSCAVAPSGVDAASNKPTASALGSAPVATSVSIAILVTPLSLREAVRSAASEHATLGGFVLVEEATSTTQYTIALTYHSIVDASGQMRNCGGSVAGGPVTMIFGAVFPWSCPTTHTLTAVVTRTNGEQVGAYDVSEVEKKVGTMIWCPDVTEPDESIAAKLASEVFRKIMADNVLR